MLIQSCVVRFGKNNYFINIYIFMENIDLVFLFVIAAFVGYYMCKKESFDTVEGFAAIDDARQAVREVYNADVDAIRGLTEVAKKLQAGGLTHPGKLTVNGGNDNVPMVVQSNTDSHILLRTKNDGNKDSYLINRDGHHRIHMAGVGDMFGVNHDGHLYNEHTGDHVAHHIGRGGNPYITLSRAGQWGNSSWYMQNLHNDHPANSTFRIGKHDVGSKLDIGSNGFLYSKGAQFNAVGDTHIPLIVQSNHDSHIQLTTKNDGNKNVYLINRDGHFRVHHHAIGDRLEVNRDGNTVVNGNLIVNGGSITLNGPGGNKFTFELSADDSRAHDGGQRMVIKNKHGGRVLDIYQGEVKNWKEGQPEPVTIFSRGSGAHSYLNVRQHGFYTSTNACGNATWGHMGCNLRHALS
jgi:hypothetical protein